MLNLKDFPPLKAGNVELRSVLTGGRRVLEVAAEGQVLRFRVVRGAWVLEEEVYVGREVPADVEMGTSELMEALEKLLKEKT